MNADPINQEPGSRPEFFGRYEDKYLWLIFALWVAYGQLIAYGIAEKYIYELVFAIWDAALRHIPSIARLKDVYSFGVDLARLQVTAMLISTPALFILLLAISVESTVQNVRAKKKEALGASILLTISLMWFVSGFGYEGPGKMFYKYYVLYSMFTAAITYLNTYLLRVAFCLVANK